MHTEIVHITFRRRMKLKQQPPQLAVDDQWTERGHQSSHLEVIALVMPRFAHRRFPLHAGFAELPSRRA